MPDFTHPLALLLLTVAAFVAWRAWAGRRRAMVYSDLRLFDALPAGRARRARFASALMRGLVLALTVLALAGPRWPDERTRVPTEGIAIEVILDTSGSMGQPDFDWQESGRNLTISRLAAAKRAFHLFVAGGEGPDGTVFPGRPTDLIGMVTFARVPESVCPLTLSHSVLLKLLEEQQASTDVEAGTNIGDAIAEALNRLESVGGRKVILLLSDGEHNYPGEDADPALRPLQAAQLAASQNVPIYTIDCGGEPLAGDEDAIKRREEGRRGLEGMAQLTNGRSFRAGDGAGLLVACQTIDRLERRPIESFQYRRYYEGYPWLALAALACALAVRLLESAWWRRAP
jgi:Ca-activated chloride channel family protein